VETPPLRALSDRTDLIGGRFYKVAPFAHDLRRVIDSEELGRKIDLGPQRMQAILEVGDDTEIAAAAAHGPEEIGVFVRAGRLHVTRRGDDFDRHQVVHGEAPFAAQIAHAAAQRQPADAGVGDVASGRDEVEDLGLPVDVGKPRTALDVDCHGVAVDPDGAHLPQIDDDATVADGAAADVVAAAAHADQESVRSGERHCGNDIRQAAGLGDQTRAPVDQAVPNPTRLVIGNVTGRQDSPAERGFEGRKDFVRDGRSGVLQSCEVNGIHCCHLCSPAIATKAMPRQLQHQCPIVRFF